jgi:hypothetical protein
VILTLSIGIDKKYYRLKGSNFIENKESVMQGFKGFLLSSLLALLVGCSWAALAGIVGLLLLPSMFQSKGWLDLTYMLVGTILMLQALIAGCWAGWLRGSGVLIRQTVTQNAFWKTNLFIAIGILGSVHKSVSFE